jgi:uncharacterized membrane protein
MILDWALASVRHLAIFTLVAILAFELALTVGEANASTIRRLARIDSWRGAMAALTLAVGVARVIFALKGSGCSGDDRGRSMIEAKRRVLGAAPAAATGVSAA